MEKTEIEARVVILATDIIGVPITLDSAMDNTPQWDSLKHMELIFAFEDTFGVRLDESELVSLRSIGALVKRVAVTK